MSEETFRFITWGMSPEDAKKVRDQVDLAEAAGLRHYPLETGRRRILIVNGSHQGDYDIYQAPAEAV
jgi:hypothetical protein